MKQKTRKQRYREIVSADDKELNSCVIELAESYLKDFSDSQGAWLMYSLALYRTDRFKEAKKALLKTMKLTKESMIILAGFFAVWGEFTKIQESLIKLLNGIRKLTI